MNKFVLATGIFSSLLALAACGGSDGAAPPATPGSTGQKIPSASASEAIKAAAGGSVTADGLTLTIPPRALAKDATVSLALFSQAPPAPNESTGSTLLPAGAKFLGGFTISTGGAALLLPLKISEPDGNGAPGPSYLAMFNAKSGRYTIVDTATASGGSLSNDDAKGYVGVSSAAGSITPYAFFTSAGTAATPAPIALSVTAASPGPYAIGSSETFTASAADANGNPYAFTPVFSLSNPALGTVTASASEPMSATVRFGATQQSGAVQAGDARSGLHGSTDVSVQSSRPAGNGDMYAYAGTMTQVFDRILPSPMPTASTTVAIAQTVNVKGSQSFQGVPNLYDFVTSETDTGTLQTTTSQADEFEGFSSSSAPAKLLEYGSNWQDEAGDTLSYVYPAPLVLDRIPELPGNTWSNTAAASISENETNGAQGAAFSSMRTYSADGTYTETSTYPAGYFGSGSPSDHGEIVENADGSGYYSVPIYGAGDVVFSAPSNGVIAYSVYAQPSPQPSDPPIASGQITAWYSNPALYKESDADLGTAAIPAQCGASSSFGASGEKLQQTINRLDTILGYTEAGTTTTYLVAGYGAVCVQMSDVLTSYYDFQGDSLALFYHQPYQITTTTETLGLQRAGTNVIGSSAAMKRAPGMMRALSMHSAFTRAVQKERADIERAFASSLHATIFARKRGTL